MILKQGLTIHRDLRGSFIELYKIGRTESTQYVQDNVSYSKAGVIRGLHLQIPPYDQEKLIYVLRGRILDVMVDLRPGYNSSTFGHSFSIEMKAGESVHVPAGFAHGFQALTDCIVMYKVSKFYNKDAEIAIKWNDTELGVTWEEHPLSRRGRREPRLSEKDGNGISFADYCKRMGLTKMGKPR